MRIPRTLHIAGFKVPVKYGKKLIVNGDPCYGCYDTEKKEIYLSKGLSPARKREVFIHEFMHLLEDVYRIKISHENISCIGFGFSQLFANHTIDLNI